MDIKGFCPMYKVGDKITFIEPEIHMPETDGICLGFVANFLPWYRPLVRGVAPKELGLTKEGNDGYIACYSPPLGEVPEPGAHGTAFFRIHQISVDIETKTDRYKEELGKRGIGWPPNKEKWHMGGKPPYGKPSVPAH